MKITPPLMNTICRLLFSAMLSLLICSCTTTQPQQVGSSTQYLDSSGNIRLADGSVFKPEKNLPARQYAQVAAPAKRQGRTFWDYLSEMWSMDNYDQNLSRAYMASGIVANQAAAATAYQSFWQPPAPPRTYSVTPAGYGAYRVHSY